MSELLKKHQKREFRFEGKELKLFEPSDFQRNELGVMVAEGSKIEGDELKGELGLKAIRYIIGELTNIGDVGHLADEELESLLDNGDRELQLLMREIEVLLHEVAEDLVYQTTRSMKLFNDMINTMDVNGDAAKLEKKWNRFAKKYKLNMTWQELAENASKREELENKLREIK